MSLRIGRKRKAEHSDSTFELFGPDSYHGIRGRIQRRGDDERDDLATPRNGVERIRNLLGSPPAVGICVTPRNRHVNVEEGLAADASSIARTHGLKELLSATGRRALHELLDCVSPDLSFELQTHIRYRLQQFLYEAPADPDKTIRVDPATVEYLVTGVTIEYGLGQVTWKDWNRTDSRVPLDQRFISRGLRQRFEEGRDWQDTVYFERARERLFTVDEWWGYEDIDQFRDVRCSYIDDVFDDIRQNGYRENENVFRPIPNTDRRRDDWKEHSTLEILLVIDGDGETYLADGEHRLAIAKTLGIDSVPANVLVRHREWQRVRDRIAMRGASRAEDDVERHLAHPDLADLLLGHED